MTDADSANDTAVVGAVQAALAQNDVMTARDLFLTLPCLPLHHAKWLQDVFQDLYCHGRIEIHTAIAFLDKLPDPLWALAGVRVVYRAKRQFEWEKTPPVQLPAIALASFVHQLSGELTGADRVEAETLWHAWFCATTHAVVLGRPLVLQASTRREVLYSVSDASAFDWDRRYVFTWRQQWTPKLVEKEQWLVVPVDDTWERFTIESVAFSEMLYVEKLQHMTFRADSAGQTRHRVFTWRNHSEPLDVSDARAHWQLVPVDGSRTGEFTIYNAATHAYLTCPDDVFDDERRHVLCGKQSSTETSDRVWRVLPQRMTAVDTGVAAFYGQRYDDAETLLTRALDDTDDRLDVEERIQCLLLRAVSGIRVGKETKNARADLEALENLGGEKAVHAIGLSTLWNECAKVLGLSTTSGHVMESPATALVSVRELMEQGDQLFVLKEYEKALTAYSLTAQIRVESTNTLLQTRQATAQLGRVKCLYVLNQPKEALAVLEELVTAKGDRLGRDDVDVRVLLWQARCERRLARYGNATATLVRALDAMTCLPATSSPRAVWLAQSITIELEVVRIFERRLVDQLLTEKQDASQPEANADSAAEQLVLSLRCPLSFEFMKDPVMTPSGMTYERAMIEWHLDAVGAWDPMTRKELDKTQLYPNRALQVVLETMLREHALGNLLASCNS